LYTAEFAGRTAESAGHNLPGGKIAVVLYWPLGMHSPEGWGEAGRGLLSEV
jgi:hypothetical protein